MDFPALLRLEGDAEELENQVDYIIHAYNSYRVY